MRAAFRRAVGRKAACLLATSTSLRHRVNTLGMRIEWVPPARCARLTALFVSRGYVRTTLADIADEAGVAVPTIKLAYGNKRSVLLAAWDRAVKSGPDPRPVAEQEWFQEILAAPDAHQHLRLQATYSRQVKARIAPLVEVIRAAAAADPEIDALWTGMQREFRENQQNTIRALQRKGRLREGLTEESATDLLYTLNHPTIYSMLVVQLGWPPEQYDRWLADTLITQLLDEVTTPPTESR